MRNVGATSVSQTSWLEHFCWSPSAELGHFKGPVQLWIYGHMHKSYIDFFSSLLNRGGEFKSFYFLKKTTFFWRCLKDSEQKYDRIKTYINICIHIYKKISLDFTFYREYFCLLWQKWNFWHLVLPMSHVYVWNCFTVHEGLITFQGLWLHFVSIIGWAMQEFDGFGQSLPQEESGSPREWKNTVTWLLLALFILCMCPSCW